MDCDSINLFSNLLFIVMAGILGVCSGNRKEVYLYERIVTYSGGNKIRQRCEWFPDHAFYSSPKWCFTKSSYGSCRNLFSGFLHRPSSRLAFQEWIVLVGSSKLSLLMEKSFFIMFFHFLDQWYCFHWGIWAGMNIGKRADSFLPIHFIHPISVIWIADCLFYSSVTS